MKKQFLISLLVFVLFLTSCSESEIYEVVDAEGKIGEEQKVLKSDISLEHVDTQKMTAGTHRPEILEDRSSCTLLNAIVSY